MEASYSSVLKLVHLKSELQIKTQNRKPLHRKANLVSFYFSDQKDAVNGIHDYQACMST